MLPGGERLVQRDERLRCARLRRELVVGRHLAVVPHRLHHARSAALASPATHTPRIVAWDCSMGADFGALVFMHCLCLAECCLERRAGECGWGGLLCGEPKGGVE